MAAAVLAGGFCKGDRVSMTIDHAPQNISKGGVGTVVGPCNNAKLDQAAERVLVDFGEGKGEVNCHGKTHLEHAPLPGAWRKGDRVSMTIDHAPQNISKGDVGTVVGPCNNAKLDQAAERVLVDFGEGKGEVNCNGKTQLEHASEEALKEEEDAQLAAAIAASLDVSDPVAPPPPPTLPAPPPLARVKRWGDGLEAPAAGLRNFVPQGFEVTLDVSDAIARFGHSAS